MGQSDGQVEGRRREEGEEALEEAPYPPENFAEGAVVEAADALNEWPEKASGAGGYSDWAAESTDAAPVVAAAVSNAPAAAAVSEEWSSTNPSWEGGGDF
eukprot:gb/GEZN01026499.1/.p1 GENE.gb/GEZN01026499.1/~~gb/GEZN01026499.1/.p1  ORF type:complete len:100 (-),score=34.63 gb/GEZN01026499.1/:100-399(-)